MANLQILRVAAERLNIKNATLTSAARSKKIPARKSGSIWLVDLDDPIVQAYAQQHAAIKVALAGLATAPKVRTSKCGECGLTTPANGVKFCGKACFGRSMVKRTTTAGVA